MAVPDLRPAQAATDERPHRHREPVWRPRPTLAGTDYTTQAVFDQERERIWFDGWVCVGRSSEIVAPGDYIVRDIVGESIVVNRDLAGRPRAFYNVCAHRGTQLVDPAPDCGHVNKVFKCPYHAWSYDLEGRFVGTPNVHEDEQFERGDHPLHAIAADEYGGFVFVSLAAEPQPLVVSLKASVETITDFERYRMDELRLGARIVYEVKANWKTVVENYNECLHCPTVHPELVAVIPMYRSGEVWDGETRDGGNPMRDDATSFSIAGTSDLPRFPDLLPEDYGMYYGAFQFPNLMINLHPDSVMAYLLYPRAARSHDRHLRVLLPARDDRRPGLHPGLGGRALGHRQPPGLGGLRTGPDRHRLARLYERCLPAQGPAGLRLQRALARGDGSTTGRLNGAGAARPRSVVADVCALRTGVTLV